MAQAIITNRESTGGEATCTVLDQHISKDSDYFSGDFLDKCLIQFTSWNNRGKKCVTLLL